VDDVGVVAKGRGAKPSRPEGTVAEVVRVTLNERPDDTSMHWSTRSVAEKLGIGKDTVARVWRDHQLKPWKFDTFKISNDPRFEEKLVDVVGLYLDPPARAVVFSLDEKTQCQALDRTQPSLPMVRGRVGTMTHDYKRNGTTDLFAALNLATGEVITQCRRGHTAADVLAFSRRSTGPFPAVWTSMSCWTTCRLTKPLRSASGSLIPAGPVGTCTSRPPRARGLTSWSGGSRN
jgi:hypothetical protein